MIIIETDNVFNFEVLNTVNQITDSLMFIKGISHVTSLTNIIDIKSSEWGIEISKLIDPYEIPQTEEEIEALRNRVFEKDMYRGVLVSTDSTTTVIVATLLPDANTDSVINVIYGIIESINPDEKIYYAGIPFMMNDVQKIILNDLLTLLPIVALIILIILFIGFRSVRGVILPLLTVILATIWTLGLMTLLNFELTVISEAIPIALFALGSAYTIHVLNRINKTKDQDPAKSLVKAMAYITVPIFLAFITTCFGFLSFVFGAYLEMIKEFGIFTAVGISFAFLISVTFIPALISLLKFYRKTEKADKNTETNKFVLSKIADFVMQKPKTIVMLWFLVAVISVIGVFFIERKVDIVSYFKKSSSTRTAQDIIDEKLGGASPFYLILNGDVQSPEMLELMRKTQKFLKEDCENVDYTFSVADLVAQMNDAMGEGEQIPDSRDKIEQLWMLIEGEDVMYQLVNYELTEAVIQSRFASLDSRDTRKFVDEMEKYIAENPIEGVSVQLAGMPQIYNQIDISLINSQKSSLIIAVVLMLIIVSLTLWSVKDGLLSIIPLLLTILISFGFMGLTGIPLDIATVLVASVTLGVGIDYAVHILSHYRNYLDETKDLKKALTETIQVSGNAIIINVFAVALGFIVFALSKLVPLNNLGILMALSMIVSGFAAITLLPSLILLLNKKSIN